MIKFNEKGLVPAIAQDGFTGKVLMLAYMNREAYDLTVSTGRAHYYSRSRKCLWEKGATSGHYQQVLSMKYDCDEDTILLIVNQTGNACHTGAMSCFFNTAVDNGRVPFEILESLYKLVEDRRENPKEGSYTNFLLNEGVDKIAKKVGEEAVEVVIAAKNHSKDEIVYETADLMYHLMVLLADQGVKLGDIYEELVRRG